MSITVSMCTRITVQTVEEALLIELFRGKLKRNVPVTLSRDELCI